MDLIRVSFFEKPSSNDFSISNQSNRIILVPICHNMKKGYGLIEMGSRICTDYARIGMSVDGEFTPFIAVEEMAESGAGTQATPFQILGPRLDRFAFSLRSVRGLDRD
jgi:hypothetical protein